MPTRLVREGIISSERVNSLSWAGEVFYRRLISVVDDYGRFSAHPKLLRAACYPLKINEVSDDEIILWLRECVAAGLIAVYEVENHKYLEIHRFGTPRAKKSKYPNPITDENGCKRLKTDESIGTVFVFESVDVSVSEKKNQNPVSEPKGSSTDVDLLQTRKKLSSTSVGTRLPKDWTLPDEWLAWTTKEFPSWGARKIAAIADEFRDYWVGVPGQRGRKSDWQATWRNRCRTKAGQELGGSTGNVPRDPMAGAK